MLIVRTVTALTQDIVAFRHAFAEKRSVENQKIALEILELMKHQDEPQNTESMGLVDKNYRAFMVAWKRQANRGKGFGTQAS